MDASTHAQFNIHPEWLKLFPLEFEAAFKVVESVKNFAPAKENIFKAFQVVPSSIKVVIVGQDPYPNSEDAVGLAFSVQNNRKVLPGSLRNIKKELENDLKIPFSSNGDLSSWLDQGVMLLNRILTTKSGESLSHKGVGWEAFTELVIKKLSNRRKTLKNYL